MGTSWANSCRVFKFSKSIAGEHFPFDESVEIDEVADHAGGGIDRAADGDFEGVVVAVSVGVVAFAVGG